MAEATERWRGKVIKAMMMMIWREGRGSKGGRRVHKQPCYIYCILRQPDGNLTRSRKKGKKEKRGGPTQLYTLVFVYSCTVDPHSDEPSPPLRRPDHSLV